MSQAQNPTADDSTGDSEVTNDDDDEIVITGGVPDANETDTPAPEETSEVDTAGEEGTDEKTGESPATEVPETSESEEDGNPEPDVTDESESDSTEHVEDPSETESEGETSDAPDAAVENQDEVQSSDENVGLLDVSSTPTVFEATIEAGVLDEILDGVSVLVDECRLRMNGDQLKIRAVDAANVGMVDADLSASAFESYNATTGVLGVPLDRLEDVLMFADSTDLVHIELNAETRKLEIETNGMEYTLALIDPDSIRKEPDIPDMGLDNTFSIEGADFNRAIKAADMVSDHLEIATHVTGRSDIVEFSAAGDTDDVQLELDRGDLVMCDVIDGESALFSLDYLKDIKKPIPKDSVVHVKTNDTMPLKMNVEMADGALDLNYMIAPRIED
jgi:proliferating cell nuclear antigen